jgi:hypothetical protein
MDSAGKYRYQCVAALLLGCLLARASPEQRPAEPLTQRVAVIGASVSAGAGLDHEAGASITLADVVEAAIRVEHERVFDGSNIMFFMAARRNAEKAVNGALAAKPTLVIAVDFLFWLSYGVALREEDRLRSLEDGLSLLDRISCPCVVGDIPDMSAAVGKALMRWAVPKKETIERSNERIRAWAAKRTNVVILELSVFMRRLRAGERITVGAYEGGVEKLLQNDQLHTRLEGTAALAVMAFDTLARARKDLPREAFEPDPRETVKRVRAAVARKKQNAAEDVKKSK